MADEVHAQDSGTKSFAAHPEGQFGVLCVDVIALGEKLDQYPGSPPKITTKCAIVFQSDEMNDQQEPHEISAEFTVSMNEKAGLRKFLESWRGKSYTAEQARQGVPVHKLEGQAGLLSVEHKLSAKGRTYAKIKSISPLPKGMVAPTPNYVRGEYWETRRKQYAEEVSAYRAKAASSHDDYVEMLEDEDLPF